MSERIDRIRKCLELAKSSSIHEAESAMKMAQRLALKEGISLDDIGKETKQDEVIESKLKMDTATVSSWKGQLAVIVAGNFRTKVYKVNRGSESDIIIVGLKEDVEITKSVIEYAETCLNTFFKRYLKEEKERWLREFGDKLSRSDSIRIRNDYVDGYLSGLREAFKKNVEEYSLMIVTPTAVTEFMEKKHLRKGASTSRVGFGSREAYDKGYKDGKNVGSRNRIEG